MTGLADASAGRWLLLAAETAAVCTCFALIGAPSPLLFGGLFGGVVYAFGPTRSLALPRHGIMLAQAAIGVSVGGEIDPVALRALWHDIVPISLVTFATLLASVAAGQILRLRRVDPVTATFSAVAGGATGLMAVADEMGADSRIVAVVQYLRVLLILISLPLIVSLVFRPPSGTTVLPGSSDPHPVDYALVVAAATIGVAFAHLTHASGGTLLGCLFSTAILSGTVHQMNVPSGIQGVGMLLIGMQVGLRFNRQTLDVLRRMALSALLAVSATILSCAAFGVLLARITRASDFDTYLATTPGGLPAILAVASSHSVDITFVTAVQVARILVVLLLAPLIARGVRRRLRERPDPRAAAG